MLAENGALAIMLKAGARVLECACGPCIGMGQSPETDAVSVRTLTAISSAGAERPARKCILASPETAAITALRGVLTDPTTLGGGVEVKIPSEVPDRRRYDHTSRS